jgi:drug/metabolite transporter (DMT)-like permease
MAIALALLSALCYGTGDFTAGLASRRLSPSVVTGVAQTFGLGAAVFAIAVFSGEGPRAPALAWGALSGVGSAIGTLSLYRGLAVARMTVVATLSGVLTALIPVIVGVALGNPLSPEAAAGIVIALPAILLVSWHPEMRSAEGGTGGMVFGVLAGAGFGLLFVALDRAGTRSGAWPLVSGQSVSVVLLAPLALRGVRQPTRSPRIGAALTVATGVLSGLANLLFLAATGHGELAIVAVLTALYPAFTVLLARAILAEHWSRSQALGLLAAVAAVVLVTTG